MYLFFVIERTPIVHSLKCTLPFSFIVPLLSLAVTHCYLLSLVVTRCITRCHSLSFVVPLCHSLSFVVTGCTTRCHSLYHSLSLVVIRCHSLYHSLSLVVTRCTTSLSFYKRSFFHSYDIKALNQSFCKAFIKLL